MPRTLSTAFLRSWLLAFGFLGGVIESYASSVWTITGTPVPGLTNLDSVMREFIASRNIQRGALAVTYRGRLVYNRAFTWAPVDRPPTRPDQIFRIASLSKPLTSIGVMRLIENGAITLNQPIGDFLDLSDALDRRWTNITIRHLLQHRGGWDRDESPDPMFQDRQVSSAFGQPLPINRETIFRYQKRQKLDFTPGSRYAYSNFGYMLLARIIEHSSGLPYEEFMNQVIFRPVGAYQARTGRSLPVHRFTNEVDYFVPPGSEGLSVFGTGSLVPWPDGGWNLENMMGHGNLVMNMADLVRVVSALDSPSSTRLLKPGSVNLMWKRPPEVSNSDAVFYASGWLVRPTGGSSVNAWHDGSLDGTRAYLVRLSAGINWAVVFNQRELDDQSDYGLAADIAINNTLLSVPSNQWPAGDQFDSDSDGYPDSWEMNYFADLQPGIDFAQRDFDSDGKTDQFEFLAVTDPINRDSPASIRILDGQKTRALEVLAFPGRDYLIEESSTLGTAQGWQPKATFRGEGKPWIQLLDSASPTTFYRLKVTVAR